MLSNKSKDDERVKMKEEAKKRRAQIARAAKLPHVQRNESKFGDLGFVSVKVDPDSDDAWSICLKNGLIDYRELLGSFPTREDYRYLGIDNVPGTPEVNLCATDDSFRFPRQIPRVNGFKNGIVKDNSSSLTHPSKNSEKEDVPNSDVSDKNVKRSSKAGQSQEISNQENSLAKKRSGEEMGGLNSSLVTRVKDEPVSPKVVPDIATNEKSPPSGQSNEDAETRRRASSQPKAKPPVLKMPDASKPAMNTSDKTQRTHPSKIESILKEMTEILPPLTDIQTPVKSQDTRFPFPQPPPSKENSNHMLQLDKQSSAAKSDENWTNDFITSSDDESDREHEGITKPEAVLGASNQRLSASSSSSSDASSSESSSDSESSDSETESSSGRKAMKTPSLMFNSEIGNTMNSSTPHSQGRSVPSLNAPAKKAPRGKVMCGEFLEKQVSPLNSITKEAKRDVEISPFANDLTDIESDIKDSILLSETHLDQESPLQPEPHIDFTSVDPVTDIETSMERTDTPFKGKINPSNHFRSDNELTMNAELTDPSSFTDDIMDRFIFDPDFPNTGQVDDFADIMNIGKSPFGPNFPIIAMDAEAPSVPTVNIDSLNFTSADVDSSSSVGNDRSRGGKRPAASTVANSNIERSDTDRLGNSSLNSFGKNSSSTPLQGKPQSKKDIEQEWFRKIISPTKKNFDLPYVNPEKLMIGSGAKEPQTPVKASKTGPLKVRISLSKVQFGKQSTSSETTSISSPKKPPKIRGKDINNLMPKKKKSLENSKSKGKAKPGVSAVKNDRPRQSGGKDIEQIKSLMAELSNKTTSEDEEPVDVMRTPSPLRPEARVSGKQIHGTPVNAVAKKDLSFGLKQDTEEAHVDKDRTKSTDVSKKKSETLTKINSRKRTSSNMSQSDSNYQQSPRMSTNKTKRIKIKKKNSSGFVPGIDQSDDSNLGFETPNSSKLTAPTENPLVVKINISQLLRIPSAKQEDIRTEVDSIVKEEIMSETPAEVNQLTEKVRKPLPNMRIPKIVKPQEDEPAHKVGRGCVDGHPDNMDTDTSSNCSSSCKQAKDVGKDKKAKRILDGRGVKRKEWERCSKNTYPNVCGMCGALQKDSGRDPIRLGAYKTSYVEYLNLGKRSKHIADCLDASERAPKYIDAVLQYIQYLVGMEITGKMGTKLGTEEYMCITSQCIDLVEYVVNQYGKKENNNLSKYDARFIYLCLRLQSILYFKLYAIKKDSAARYSKLLSEYFKVHRSPQRVNIKGSTGTPSPMSPTSSHTGSVASFGSANSSISNGSYEKMLTMGQMVPIQTEMFERMQQYFTYTKYLLHGHRIWDDADSLVTQCQEFINSVSRRVGAINIQSSMLHLVDYISTGLDVIKDSEN